MTELACIIQSLREKGKVPEEDIRFMVELGLNPDEAFDRLNKFKSEFDKLYEKYFEKAGK